MPLQIIHQDITKIQCDAIVNPTDSYFSGRGGTDRAIHTAAGIELDVACGGLEPISFGEIAVTNGYALPCRYVIHTMGPIWQGGEDNEAMLLRSCYVNSLIKAKRLGVNSIAFPLISSGTFGFPKDKVLRIAIDAISDFLFTVDSEILVYICVLNRGAFELSKDIALREYLNRSKRFVYEDHALKMQKASGKVPDIDAAVCAPCASVCAPPKEEDFSKADIICASAPAAPKAAKPIKSISLADWIKKQDDTFAVTLLKLIDKKEMDDVECYKKANVTKNTFWKIKNSAAYKPSKPTVIAFAIALELNMDETEQLLKSAGFSLSGNTTFDRIIEFYIMNGVYDIFEINAALCQYDQMCLGC